MIQMVKLNSNLKILFVINIAISLCSGLVSPLFPLFLEGLRADVVEISLVLFIGGAASTVILVPSGLLSDRYRRRNIFILSSVMLCSAALYLTAVKSWEQTILGLVFFLSAFSVFLPSRNSLIADNADSTSVAATYSFINAAWPIGSIIGPLIGGFLADNYGWNYVFYVMALASLISIIPNFFFKRTYKGDKKLDKKKTKDKFFRRDIIILLIVFVLSQICLNTAIGIINPVIPLYLTKMFFLNKTTVGFFFSMGQGVAILLAQIPSGMLADRYSHRRVFAYSVLPLPIIIFFWPSIQNYLFLIILYMFTVGFWSMTWSVTQAYLVNLTPTLERGFVLSVRQTAVRLGFTMGPLVGGYFWNAYAATTPFYVASIFFASSFLFILFLKKQ